VWAKVLAEKEQPHFHPVFKYPSVVLSEQFSVASNHSVGGFCTGGLPCKKKTNIIYYELEILEMDTRWQSGLGLGFTEEAPDHLAATFGSAAKYPRTAKQVPRNWLLGYDGTIAVVNRATKYVHPREYLGPPWTPRQLKVGDRVGVCAHKTGLSLWVNGKVRICYNQDRIKTTVPLYALLELDGCQKSVRMVTNPVWPDVAPLREHLAKIGG
jgi:hypothetical protein